MINIFKNSVIAKLQGGIGNQLFIYACAKSLSIEKNKKLFLDCESGFFKDKFRRKIELKSFLINDKYIILKGLNKYIYIYFMKFIILFFKKFRIKNYKEDSIGIEEFSKSEKNFYILDGYFQSETFFHKYKKIIKENLVLKEMSEQLISEINFFSKDNYVALHKRDFDFDHERLREKKRLNLDETYYIKSISFFKSKYKNPKVIVFSDQKIKIKKLKNFFPDIEIKLYENKSKFTDTDILWLMSNFKNIIISNSTFSWWAAWLNNNNSKKILCPSLDFNIDNWKSNLLINQNFIQIK